ncbi:hypothetical protein FZC35_02015 [Candidatus Cytomitobacter indipagum]|uniref:Uncharacterized protein n=1 Tax=Candidatus Cytomitobacter indipagum TaxID=2601575 RepID=A0A5C0UEL4_9PROT|nr:hypothetical protein [Candidatus Cytomitobacter indipagum]QEK38140.1 hypothetical protein FZC35_02015 [Candidatus Cytomitobacter indipagum]
MYKFFRIPFIYLATFLNIYAGIVEYDFSIEDVGQGNCQIMKYVIDAKFRKPIIDSIGEDGSKVLLGMCDVIERKTVAFLYDCGKTEYSKNLGTKLGEDEASKGILEFVNKEIEVEFKIKGRQNKIETIRRGKIGELLCLIEEWENKMKEWGNKEISADYTRWRLGKDECENNIKKEIKEVGEKLIEAMLKCKKIHQYFPILKEVNREKFDKLSDKDKKELLKKISWYIYHQSLVKEEQESDKSNQSHSISTMAHNLRVKLQNLDYLFIILSHPEGDHISFISKLFGCECNSRSRSDKHNDSAEDFKNCKIMSILCGDWRKSDSGGKVSGVAGQILKCLKYRSHILIEPFAQKQEFNLPEFFSGDIKSMFSKFVAEKSFISGFDAIIKELKDHIYIWSMNTTGNPNAQSPIISFTGTVDGSSKAYSVICAGDAEDSTFSDMLQGLITMKYEKEALELCEKMKKLNDPASGNDMFERMKFFADEGKRIASHPVTRADYRKNIIDSVASRFKNDKVALVAPHHGSEEQWQVAISLARLFCANILYVSNGHGGQQPHIHANFFKNLTNAFNPRLDFVGEFFKGNSQITFESQYSVKDIDEITWGKKITVYQKKGDEGEKRPCSIWLFSTNDHGSLRIACSEERNPLAMYNAFSGSQEFLDVDVLRGQIYSCSTEGDLLATRCVVSASAIMAVAANDHIQNILLSQQSALAANDTHSQVSSSMQPVLVANDASALLHDGARAGSQQPEGVEIISQPPQVS